MTCKVFGNALKYTQRIVALCMKCVQIVKERVAEVFGSATFGSSDVLDHACIYALLGLTAVAVYTLMLTLFSL